MKKKFGVQISSNRLTKLEKELIKYNLILPKSAVGLDLGAGNGYISMILALMHKKIYYYDLKVDFKIKIFKKIFNLKKLILVKKDIRKIKKQEIVEKIDFVYSARFLHYLTYAEAEELLEKIFQKMKTGAKVFFTISGLNSDIGLTYKCKNEKIQDRNCKIKKHFQKRFQIKEKITLYTKEEARLLFEKFFDIQEIWESDFHNIFIIAEKK